jgi:3-oxoacyl-[acyl-carrier-protein] synthase-3
MAHTAPRSRILGTGHYLPSVVRTNADLEKMVDTTDAWIAERTGIRERRIAPDGVFTSDMATSAAKEALAMAGLAATDIDMIIVGTVTPCAGFVYGLTIADQFVRSGAMKHVLVIGVELLSRVIDWSDRTTCVLFGDGAGAMVVGPTDGSTSGILSTAIHTDGALAQSLMIPGGGSVTPASHPMIEQKLHKVHMRGQDIFKVAVKNLVSASKNALELAEMKAEELDWVCAHQANARIIDQVTSRFAVPKEKVLMNIDRVGNTSSASIPILVDENFRAGKIKKGDTVLMCALGAGISWGSALVRM